jgi:hypothetical protein
MLNWTLSAASALKGKGAGNNIGEVNHSYPLKWAFSCIACWNGNQHTLKVADKTTVLINSIFNNMLLLYSTLFQIHPVKTLCAPIYGNIDFER